MDAMFVLELQSEVGLLSRMHHPNVISLLGYCVDGQSKFIVYELMQNGSLETHLYGRTFSLVAWLLSHEMRTDVRNVVMIVELIIAQQDLLRDRH